MTDLKDSPLGHSTTWASVYDPELLFPVERAAQRRELGIADAPPFRGVDVWNAYEVSWQDPRGKPEVAIATFVVPAESPRIVESKSVKLYLTALNLTRFASREAVTATIARDLAVATGTRVGVTLTPPEGFAALPHAEPAGESIDTQPLSADDKTPVPGTLVARGAIVAETLFTRLFRSVCPVTGQPDYASVEIRYSGARIDRAGLLRYLVSFRRHAGFHEHCVERIFVEIRQRCAPTELTVHGRFTRRGGIDINPWRTSGAEPAPINARTAQQ
jgi:7-cyano-7-deazaguanine reductase